MLTDKFILDSKESNRYEDENGFLCVKHNPIAKAGVFQYLGKSVGKTGNDANNIYNVYRPFSELEKTMKEFEGMPIVLSHEWVEGTNNPKVVGTVAGKVTAEYPYLYADIKIIDDEARRCIENGTMQELSPGYYGDIIDESGEVDGIPYDYVMGNIHYNHLALVEQGRSGHDLRVLDGKEVFMQTEQKLNDTNFEKLKALLVQFLNEEAREAGHQEEQMANNERDLTDDEIIVDDEVLTDDEVVIDEDDKTCDDNDCEVKDDEEELKDGDDDEESEEVVVIPEEDDEEVVEDDDNDDTVAEVVLTKDEVNKLMDSALRSYKKEHARSMKAYDEVSQVVGKFKTYDSAGELLNENAIYKIGCNRLGLLKIQDLRDYKSAFKAGAYMKAKLHAGRVAQTNTRHTEQLADTAEINTIDGLIKSAFRNR